MKTIYIAPLADIIPVSAESTMVSASDFVEQNSMFGLMWGDEDNEFE